MQAEIDKLDNVETLETTELIERYLGDKSLRPCVTCSFQAEGMVLVDLLRKVDPDIPVIFLDTGYHFAETYAYRDRMARRWGLNLINVKPQTTVAQQESAHGRLYQFDPARCCQMRKVEPLARALAPFDVWFAGLQREHSAARKHVRKVETRWISPHKSLLKVHPLADWNRSRIWNYLEANDIEYLPLYNQGYTSIGCEPCTSRPLDVNDLRSGRWGGQKLECGIHTFSIQG